MKRKAHKRKSLRYMSNDDLRDYHDRAVKASSDLFGKHHHAGLRELIWDRIEQARAERVSRGLPKDFFGKK